MSELSKEGATGPRVAVSYQGDTSSVMDALDPHILVSEQGCSCFLGPHRNTSRYNGVTFYDPQGYRALKCIHDILPQGLSEVSLRVWDGCTQRLSAQAEESFFFHDRIFCYEVHGDAAVDISFDIRELYDLSTEGREHRVSSSTSGGIERVHVSSRGVGFVVFSTAPLEVLGEWVERPCPYDERRGDQASWWVFSGLRIRCADGARLVCAAEARAHDARILITSPDVWGRRTPLSTDIVSALCEQSLHGLITKTPAGEAGILAGLPWFFQVWTRDEALSCSALLADRPALSSSILLREIAHLLPDGRMANRFPPSVIGSADGIGWSFFMLRRLFSERRGALSEQQWRFVLEQLRVSLSGLCPDGDLVRSGPSETWMDTTGGLPDTRSGARVEIQALTASMLSLAEDLSARFGDADSASTFAAARDRLLARVREGFVRGGVLRDGLDDDTCRPNVFLAARAYPALVDDAVWDRTFRDALSRLLLPWGGLASIDQSHRWFVREHTGGDDRSYHRGDSWYFVNNIAAQVLLGREGFLEEALALYDASVRDLLSLGAAGHCSEITGASRQEAFGCWAQAWSAATLLELHRGIIASGRLSALRR